MLLTQSVLDRFRCGQLRILRGLEGSLCRGEIGHAWIEDDVLCVRFKWLAREEGGNLTPPRWVAEQSLEYKVSHSLVLAREIGAGRIDFILTRPECRDSGTFFPPYDHDRLDPAMVEGLNTMR